MRFRNQEQLGPNYTSACFTAVGCWHSHFSTLNHLEGHLSGRQPLLAPFFPEELPGVQGWLRADIPGSPSLGTAAP